MAAPAPAPAPRTSALSETAVAELKQLIYSGAVQPGERLNVTQIAEASTLARPTVSHHLKVLREAGVLLSEKKGKEVFYWIDKPFLQQSLGAVTTYIDTEC